MAETADLKTLARKVLQRDTTRDSGRDRMSRNCLAAEARPRQHFNDVSPSRPVEKRDSEIAIPAAYARTLAALGSCYPDLVPVERWRRTVKDGHSCLAKWGEQAQMLGWTARDLFGLHPIPANAAPSYRRLSRYDETGLIWQLQGRPVVALTADTAAIKNPTGAVTVYRRHNKPALGPVGDCLGDFER
jgi:hypothetical protein